MSTKENKHLHYLHELSDYKVHSDDPDVRGWEVKDSVGQTIGTVDNLLVSKDAMKVRYLDVEVDNSIINENHEPFEDSALDGVHEFVNHEGETHLIVPIGMARIDTDNKVVCSDQIERDKFSRTKRISKGQPVDRDYELYALRAYRGPSNVPLDAYAGNAYYERDEFKNTYYDK